MSKGFKGYVDLPTTKVRCWADHGKTSAEIAKLIGISADDLWKRLDELALRNRKSASQIRGLIERNDRAEATKQAKKNPTQKQKQVQTAPAPAPITHTVAKTPTPEAPTTQPAQRTEAEIIADQIEELKRKLSEIDHNQESASAEIKASKTTALQYELKLQGLIEELKSCKAAYEQEIERVRQAEQLMLSCEGQRAQCERQLTELQQKLDELRKPEVLVYKDGTIEVINLTMPEHIDTSNWAKLITSLPAEIGEELRKKDAETLLKVQAIVGKVDKDVDLIFEDEMLQKAFEALRLQ